MTFSVLGEVSFLNDGDHLTTVVFIQCLPVTGSYTDKVPPGLGYCLCLSQYFRTDRPGHVLLRLPGKIRVSRSLLTGSGRPQTKQKLKRERGENEGGTEGVHNKGSRQGLFVVHVIWWSLSRGSLGLDAVQNSNGGDRRRSKMLTPLTPCVSSLLNRV